MRGLWSLHAYRYQGQMALNNETHAFRAGCVSLIPPDILVEWRFPSHAPHYYAHFKMGSSKSSPGALPFLQDLGERFERFSDLFEELIQFQNDDATRASVRLWDLLHQLRGNPTNSRANAPLHPNLQIALSIIRNRQSETLWVGEIARTMGVSDNHLTQLFKNHFGCGAREYLQRERISRASHLLSHSSLSIKSIANEVGIPDLHYFNKLIRKTTGFSPRDYRLKSKNRRRAV
jgi:AraC family transcriptional regulator